MPSTDPGELRVNYGHGEQNQLTNANGAFRRRERHRHSSNMFDMDARGKLW